MRFFRPCVAARWIYRDAFFRIMTTEKLLCLTFDDGPDPGSTPQILELLEKYSLKALFFCNGRNAKKYPALVEQIKAGGHLIGNHGYSHLNGWLRSQNEFVNDVEKADPYTSSGLFRPPFGRMRYSQYKELKIKYKIFFWDIMPYDFDQSFGYKRSLKAMHKRLRPGSIIVLHDKPHSSALVILNQFIDYCLKCDYRFILPEV